jgi:PEGA domain
VSARAAAAAIALAVAPAVLASEKLGVIAVADPPGGPDADLGEMAHQLRAACRDRVGGVEDVPAMRARLLGQGSNATLSELDRAYGGALAVYQNGEFESAVRTLRAIVEDLENLPESEEAYEQWKRANLRLVHAAQTIGLEREVERTLAKLARTEPTLQPDPEQYSPTYRRRFEEMKARIRALPRRRLQIVSEGKPGAVYVNGRSMGTTPVTLTLPSGTYRIGGAAGALRVPSFSVDLEAEDRMVVLDFALAEAVRVNAGPGLALPQAQRAYGIIRAGAWLGVDKLVVASRIDEGGAQFLLGSIYDVRRGALLREGSVRMVAGSVPSVNLGALASFLLTGQSSRDVKDRTREIRREVIPPEVASVRDLSPATPGAAGRSGAAAAPLAPVASAAPGTRAGSAPPPPSSAARSPASAATAPAAAAVASAPAKAAVPAPRPVPASGTAPSSRSSGPGSAIASARAAAADPGARPSPSLSARPLASAPPAAAPGPARAPGSAPRWMRPAAIGAGVGAVVLGALAIQQGVSASSAYRKAGALVGPGDVVPYADLDRYRSLRADGDASARNAWVSAGFATACAVTAGVLGWISWDREPAPALALRF